MQDRICEWCGVPFTRKSNRQKFCHPECKRAHRSAVPCEYEGCEKGRRGNAQFCPMHYGRLKRRGSLELPSLNCKECGAILKRVSGKGKPPTICYTCLDGQDHAAYSKRLRGAIYAVGDRITIGELGDRDGWRCHLCGLKVRKRGGRDGRAPSIDHLIPVSDAASTHTWVNVALAHKSCNSKRINRGAAQLRLIA